MIRNYEATKGKVKVDIPFEPAERSRYEDFLKRTGRRHSRGDWVRTLIIRAMDAEQSILDGQTQVDMTALRPVRLELGGKA
ncbi:MAG: hypothetical protein ACOYM2_22140 [Rectinemataceae bacterium]